ncbi:hypothetical protein [Microbacterium sp. NPDC056736]|uniref:hypothetical protein n=1 Tax=Microbacterium sp. NPDC056736 TaxID=3345932 RepID=UPI00366DA93E
MIVIFVAIIMIVIFVAIIIVVITIIDIAATAAASPRRLRGGLGVGGLGAGSPGTGRLGVGSLGAGVGAGVGSLRAAGLAVGGSARRSTRLRPNSARCRARNQATAGSRSKVDGVTARTPSRPESEFDSAPHSPQPGQDPHARTCSASDRVRGTVKAH